MFHLWLLIQYIASTIVVPLVKTSMLGWVPLAGKNESLPHLTTFTQWKDILEDDASLRVVSQPGEWKKEHNSDWN